MIEYSKWMTNNRIQKCNNEIKNRISGIKIEI